ncbi:DUF1616 domain-containing protein [Halomicroarcula sp. GCM10025709]|uniref:DUF1616 domain-containing protein n=1 Tax=Halomicroarcula sp. GCM10025709 TaxID=3252669 RepID=UPI003609350C
MTDREGIEASSYHFDRLPADIWLVFALTVLLWIVTLVPLLNGSPLRVGLAVFYALFVPGYTLIATLFPERPPADETPVDDEGTGDESGIDGLERLVLSFGSSIALVPLVGLGLNFTPWGLRLIPILVALTAVTVGFAGLASVRRSRLAPEQQFDPKPLTLLRESMVDLREPDDQVELVINIVLVLSVCLAAGSVVYATTSPVPGESFTEFYLLPENESGELVAEGYPTNMTHGQRQSLVVGIGNSEADTVRYTVVAELQRATVEGDQVTVVDRRKLDQFSRQLAPNETVQVRRTITPEELVGDRLRLQFRLYRGQAAAVNESEAPYRELHLWVNVTSTPEGQKLKRWQ